MFALLISASAYTQSSKLNIGVYGGAGISNTMMFSFDNPGFGYDGGLQLEYNISKKLSLVSGMGYERISSMLKFDINDSLNNPQPFTFNNRFNFITIPLLARVNFGSKMKFFINAGPSFNYLVSQKSKSVNNTDNTTYNSTNTELFNRLEMALEIGAGMSYPISEKISISMELRNKTGLTNIRKSELSTQKTFSLLLNFGVNYSL